MAGIERQRAAGGCVAAFNEWSAVALPAKAAILRRDRNFPDQFDDLMSEASSA